jgi:hypothetical protein
MGIEKQCSMAISNADYLRAQSWTMLEVIEGYFEEVALQSARLLEKQDLIGDILQGK